MKNSITFLWAVITLCAFTPSLSKAESTNLFTVIKETLDVEIQQLKNFQVSIAFNDLKSKKRIRLNSEYDKTIIQLEIIKPQELESTYNNAVKTSFTLIKNLYGPSASPYPGTLSKERDCLSTDTLPKTYILKKQEIVFNVLEGATNERLSFGACLAIDKKFQGALYIFKNKEAIATLKAYIPIKQYRKNTNYFRDFITK